MDIASLSVKVSTSGVQQAATDLDKLQTSSDKAAKSTENLNKSFSRGAGSASPIKTTSAAVREQTAALAKLAGQIDPTIAKLDKLDALQTQLGKFKKSGMISADDFTALNATLDASRAKIGGASDAVHKFSLNNSLARRELGYLAKDLALGNYGRFTQSALTLANASGVMKLAFSGMGAAVLGAVAAVALFAVGAFKGAAESEELRKSVIATGGAAGITGAAFRSISQDIGSATGSYSDAAKAIAVFSTSTKVAGVDVQALGTAAVNMAKVTGISVEKAADAILSLSKDPANAVAELTEKYNFLTSAQYAYIRALEDSGQSERASAVAQGIAAQAFADRAKDVDDGAGVIIRAAHAVGRAWDSAWDSIKGIGATKGLGDQVKDVQAKIASLTGGAFMPNGNFQQGADDNDPRVKALQAQLDNLRGQQAAAGFKATDDAQAALANQQSIAAQKRLSAFNTPDVTLVNTIKKAGADRLAALYGVVDPAQKKLIESQFTKQVQDANDAYQSAISKGVKAPKTPKAAPDFRAQDMRELQAEIEAEGKLFDQRERSTAAVAAYRASLQDMLATRQASIDLQVASIGMGAKEVAQQQALIAIDEDYNRQKASLERQQRNSTSEIDKAGFTQQLADLKKYHDERVKIETDGAARVTAAQSNGLNGMRTAAQNFIDQQNDMAGQMEAITSGFLDGFGDAFADFVDGTKSAKDAFGSLIDSMYHEALKFVANQAVKQLLESFSNTGGGSASAGGPSAGGWAGLFSSLVGAFSNSSGPGTIGAGLATGGPASAGSIHPVVEKGPEILSVGGKSYLMMGKQSGQVTPLSDARGAARSPTYVTNINVQPTSTRRTAEQVASATARTQRVATARNA